jgi:hypothetical protein
VRRAATDLDTRVSDRKPSAFIGAPTNLVLERTIDGEVPVDEYETLSSRSSASSAAVGQASTLGRSLVWTMHGVDRRRVSTRTVQITSRRAMAARRSGWRSRSVSSPGPVRRLYGRPRWRHVGDRDGDRDGGVPLRPGRRGLIGGMVAGSYVLARTIFGRMVRSRGERMQRLMSRLAEHVGGDGGAHLRGEPPRRASRARPGRLTREP